MVDSAYSWNPKAATDAPRHHRQDIGPGPSGPQWRQTGDALVEGQVRNIEKRMPVNGRAVLHFRVEQFDHEGGRRRRIPVQFVSFGGALGKDLDVHEGDRVRVHGQWDTGTVIATQVENLTTRASTKSRKWSTGKTLALAAGVLLVPTVIFGAIALGLAHWATSSFNRDGQQTEDTFRQERDEMQRHWCQDAANAGAHFSQCDDLINGTP